MNNFKLLSIIIKSNNSNNKWKTFKSYIFLKYC